MLVVPGQGGAAPQLYVAGGVPTGTVEVYSTAPDAKGQLPLLQSVRAHTGWCGGPHRTVARRTSF